MGIIFDRGIAGKFNLYLYRNTYFFQITDIEIATRPSTSSLKYNINGNITYKPGERWRLRWDAIYLSRTFMAHAFNTDFFLSNFGVNFQFNECL